VQIERNENLFLLPRRRLSYAKIGYFADNGKLATAFLHFHKDLVVIQKSLFGLAKEPILECEIGSFGIRLSLFRNPKEPLLEIHYQPLTTHCSLYHPPLGS